MRLQKNKIEELINKIEQYDYIAIFRHEAPDFDALGSQNGLYFWLKNNFPEKNFFVLGDSNTEVGKNLFPEYPSISDDELFSKPFLGILLDTYGALSIGLNGQGREDDIVMAGSARETEELKKMSSNLGF